MKPHEPGGREQGKSCKLCGRWSNSPEFGMDMGSGYCEVWEKITSATFGCDRFVSKAAFKREQEERFEQMVESGEYEE